MTAFKLECVSLIYLPKQKSRSFVKCSCTKLLFIFKSLVIHYAYMCIPSSVKIPFFGSVHILKIRSHILRSSWSILQAYPVCKRIYTFTSVNISADYLALHGGSDLCRNEQRGPFIHPELGGVGGVPFSYMQFMYDTRTLCDMKKQVKTLFFHLWNTLVIKEFRCCFQLCNSLQNKLFVHLHKKAQGRLIYIFIVSQFLDIH